MRRKISAILVTVLIMLTVMPMGAFAAVPSVQEVETRLHRSGQSRARTAVQSKRLSMLITS